MIRLYIATALAAINVSVSAGQLILPTSGALLSYSGNMIAKKLTSFAEYDLIQLVGEVPAGQDSFSFSLSHPSALDVGFYVETAIQQFDEGVRSGRYQLTYTGGSSGYGYSSNTAVTSFRPGTWLLPSNDPDCASFLCMDPVKDRAWFSYTIGVSATALPEPSAYALLVLFGVTAAGITAYRRRYQA